MTDHTDPSEVCRLLAIGIATVEGHTFASFAPGNIQPGPQTMNQAAAVLTAHTRHQFATEVGIHGVTAEDLTACLERGDNWGGMVNAATFLTVLGIARTWLNEHRRAWGG